MYRCIDLYVKQDDNPISCTVLTNRWEFKECRLTVTSEGTITVQSRLRGFSGSFHYVNIVQGEVDNRQLHALSAPLHKIYF